MRVTLKDIVEKTGVSKSVVSMYLNKDPRVRLSDEKKKRIDEAVRELGYRPSLAACALRKGRSRMLGLVLGFSAVVGASTKVGAVHAREEQLRSGLDDLKQRVRQLQRVAAGIPDLPAADRSRIDALAGELRFVAPCRTAEAAALEKEFGEALQTLEFALPAHAMNRGAVESALARAERLCAERKTLYTN